MIFFYVFLPPEPGAVVATMEIPGAAKRQLERHGFFFLWQPAASTYPWSEPPAALSPPQAL